MQNQTANAENLKKELEKLGSQKEMEQYMQKKIAAFDQNHLTALLQDPNALEKLLRTKEARALLQKLMEDS